VVIIALIAGEPLAKWSFERRESRIRSPHAGRPGRDVLASCPQQVTDPPLRPFTVLLR
jgi:hypothetical protein